MNITKERAQAFQELHKKINIHNKKVTDFTERTGKRSTEVDDIEILKSGLDIDEGMEKLKWDEAVRAGELDGLLNFKIK